MKDDGNTVNLKSKRGSESKWTFFSKTRQDFFLGERNRFSKIVSISPTLNGANCRLCRAVNGLWLQLAVTLTLKSDLKKRTVLVAVSYTSKHYATLKLEFNLTNRFCIACKAVKHASLSWGRLLNRYKEL